MSDSTNAILPPGFYNRAVVEVARDLIGCCVERHLASATLLGRIVETEAYRHDDPASHSFRGKTRRNAAMFGPPGSAYVYLIYGVHSCFNVVCGPPGNADAVLIRALEPLEGLPIMRMNRFGSGAGSTTTRDRDLLSGPGKLCQALRIDRETVDGTSLQSGPVRVLSRPIAVVQPANQDAPPTSGLVVASRRIGISAARDKKWRFCLAGSAFLSKKAQVF